MTSRLQKQPDTAGDRLLRLLGKNRAYVMPRGNLDRRGPEPQTVARKESFWNALLRPVNAPLPPDMISRDTLNDLLYSGMD